MKITPLHIIITFFCISLIACDAKKDERIAIIAGKWHIQKAEKDGTLFNSLEGTVFEFSNDGSMKTNVPQIGNGTFHFDGNTLIQKNNATINYNIESLTANELIVNTFLRDIRFKMVFGRDSLIVE